MYYPFHVHTIYMQLHSIYIVYRFPSGIIRLNWNDTQNISMAPAQG